MIAELLLSVSGMNQQCDRYQRLGMIVDHRRLKNYFVRMLVILHVARVHSYKANLVLENSSFVMLRSDLSYVNSFTSFLKKYVNNIFCELTLEAYTYGKHSLSFLLLK